MDNFYSRLRKIRKTLGCTQDEFARQLKVSKPTVVRYESGGRKPDADFLSILINEFKVNINWLLMGDGEMFLKEKPSEPTITINPNDEELCQLIDLLQIPQMRRSVMAEFDQLKIIFKSLVEKHYNEIEKNKSKKVEGDQSYGI
jgi:transcriptional regulator with XRE-family HTH domain